MFISFEGGEGAGKTTLIEKIDQELTREGRKVTRTRAPGGTSVGNAIRSILLGKEALAPRAELFLFLADRAQHVEEVITPALHRGEVVLCDRFNDSTVAYQAGARGFPEEWIETLCSFATNHIKPDLTLYLDLDPLEGLKRLRHSKDRIEEEALEFHQKVRAAYLSIARKEPARFHIIDARKTPEQVFEEALYLLRAWR